MIGGAGDGRAFFQRWLSQDEGSGLSGDAISASTLNFILQVGIVRMGALDDPLERTSFTAVVAEQLLATADANQADAIRDTARQGCIDVSSDRIRQRHAHAGSFAIAHHVVRENGSLVWRDEGTAQGMS